MAIKTVLMDEETGLVFQSRSQVNKFKKLGYRRYLFYRDVIPELRLLEKKQKEIKKILFRPHDGKYSFIPSHQRDFHSNAKRLRDLYYQLTVYNKL